MRTKFTESFLSNEDDDDADDCVGTILNFRPGAANRNSLAYKSKQNNRNFANRIRFDSIRRFDAHLLRLVPFIRFLPLYCRALPHVCSANQLNFMRNGNAYTSAQPYNVYKYIHIIDSRHTRAYTYFRLQFPHHNSERCKKANKRNYTGVHIRCILLCRLAKNDSIFMGFLFKFPIY